MSWKDDEKLWDIIGSTHVDELDERGYVVIKKRDLRKLGREDVDCPRCDEPFTSVVLVDSACPACGLTYGWEYVEIDDQVVILADWEEFDDGAKY